MWGKTKKSNDNYKVFKCLRALFNVVGAHLLASRTRMFLKQYVKEMVQLGVDSIGIVLLISFFIGAVICIQIKLNVQSPWMPLWVSGYVTREIMLLEFSSSIMCLILKKETVSKMLPNIYPNFSSIFIFPPCKTSRCNVNIIFG